MPTHAGFAGSVPDVLGRYGYWQTGDPEPVAGGTLNWNFKVDSDGGPFFIRRYRDDLETPRIRGEHDLVRWAADRGVPVPVPEETPDDQTIVLMAGGRWALFPWIDGEVRARGSLTPDQARTLGALHGFAQSVLAEHPESKAATMSMTWDKDQSLGYLERIASVASESLAAQWMQDGIAKQTAMLRELEVLPPGAFSSLPIQVLHGDFHDHQVIWQGENIGALVDWEIWQTGSRVWEVLRSLAFSQLLETPRLEDYLTGYRAHVQLTEDECRLGLRLWWQSRVVGVWAWAAYFLQGNTRVDKFLPEIVAELEDVGNPVWKSRIEERFVLAACG